MPARNIGRDGEGVWDGHVRKKRRSKLILLKKKKKTFNPIG